MPVPIAGPPVIVARRPILRRLLAQLLRPAKAISLPRRLAPLRVSAALTHRRVRRRRLWLAGVEMARVRLPALWSAIWRTLWYALRADRRTVRIARQRLCRSRFHCKLVFFIQGI